MNKEDINAIKFWNNANSEIENHFNGKCKFDLSNDDVREFARSCYLLGVSNALADVIKYVESTPKI